MEIKTMEQDARILIDKIICEPKIAPLLNRMKYYNMNTFNHSVNVAYIAVQMGSWKKMKGAELEDLARGALLHDIGKMDISKSILCKTGILSDEEYEIIKKHPLHGANMVFDDGFDDIVLDIIMHHHERLDGSGYPEGIKGDISDEAAIVAVADVWDAMTSKRCYKEEFSGADAWLELKDFEGIYYKANILKLLTLCLVK